MTDLIRQYTRPEAHGTGDVDEHSLHSLLVVRYDDDGYVQIHGDVLGPIIRAAGYVAVIEDHRCRSVHHPGGSPTRCERWLDHDGHHDTKHYRWTDETRVPAPTQEAAALRSAPFANDDRCNACIPPCTNPARCVIAR